MAKPTPQQRPPTQAQRPAQTQPSTSPSQEVITKQDGAVATTEVPDYIKKGAGRGSENVEMADVVIPRIEVAQALSKCLKANDPAYIEGAKQGDLYNTVTREIYGPALRVVPVFFTKQWLAWREQTLGGGFAGAHASVADCEAAIKQQEKPDEWEATETAQQLVLVVKKDGTTEEAVVSMNKTKLKVSKQWNSLIRLNGNDRFSREYILHSVDETNAKNQDYKNYGIYNMGFAPRDIYLKGEALYNAVSSGARKMNIDNSDLDAEGSAAAGSGEY
jgi:hypothetical protein